MKSTVLTPARVGIWRDGQLVAASDSLEALRKYPAAIKRVVYRHRPSGRGVLSVHWDNSARASVPFEWYPAMLCWIKANPDFDRIAEMH